MSRPPTPSDGLHPPAARAQTPNGLSQQIAPTSVQQPPRQLAMSQSPVVPHMQYALQPPHPHPPAPSSPYDPRLHPPPYHHVPHNLQPIQPHPPSMQPQSIQPHPLQPSPYAYPPPPPHSQTPYGLANGNGGPYQIVLPHGTPSTAAQPEAPPRRRNRVQKACDVCAERKVKCSSAGPEYAPCEGCVSLNRECTYHRDSKRRGPTSKWREEGDPSKRQRTGDAPYDANPNPQSQSPESNRETASTLAAMARGANRSYPQAYAESPRDIGLLLCDKALVDRLIDDFFTYIHPLAPFPHETSFRDNYDAHVYRHDPKFLALLCSMIAALVSSFPRKPREHMRDLGLDHQFPSSLGFIERCHTAATQSRGTGYLDNKLSIYDGCTSYFLGLAAAYTFNWRRTRLYFSETLTIIRCLGAHKADPQPIHSFPYEAPDPTLPVDYIQGQIGRRLFWCMVVGVTSVHQIGATYGELFIPPQTLTNPYPPLPDEIDDKYFDARGNAKQPYGIVSRLVGFNINCKIYNSLGSLQVMELAYGIDQCYDWNLQKKVLDGCYEEVERVMRAIPPELLLKPSPNVGEFAPADGFSNGRFGGEASADAEKRLLQFEYQKANIYASQLCTRSFIVEKFFNLRDAHLRRGDVVDGAGNIDSTLQRNSLESRVGDEREGIIKEFLHVLGNISHENMEPNGLSFINKVRQIASTLMDTNENRKGPLAIRAQESLVRLLDILMKLERSGPVAGTDADSAESEEDLRIWTDLKDVQLRFLHAGGFMADS